MTPSRTMSMVQERRVDAVYLNPDEVAKRIRTMGVRSRVG